jgi:hypothetical protein
MRSESSTTRPRRLMRSASSCSDGPSFVRPCGCPAPSALSSTSRCERTERAGMKLTGLSANSSAPTASCCPSIR